MATTEGLYHINFDRPKLEALKVELGKAKAGRKTIFEFEGHEVVVRYAEYLVEYLGGLFGRE